MPQRDKGRTTEMIKGIHGRPFIEWGGVTGQYDAGYCAHGSVLFPMWHRPYLALFEVSHPSNSFLALETEHPSANLMGSCSSHLQMLPLDTAKSISSGCIDIAHSLLGLGI
jgi:hypothetical protein